MERNVEIDKISDGKRYGANDLVKVGCDDCRGCSACCHGMGDSIVLDPMDVYRLEKKLGKTMEEIAAYREEQQKKLEKLENFESCRAALQLSLIHI